MFDNDKASRTSEGDGGLESGLMLFTQVFGGWAILYYCLVSPGLRAAFILSFTDGVFGGAGSILTLIIAMLLCDLVFFPFYVWVSAIMDAVYCSDSDNNFSYILYSFKVESIKKESFIIFGIFMCIFISFDWPFSNEPFTVE